MIQPRLSGVGVIVPLRDGDRIELATGNRPHFRIY
jgi:hypothetical protein